MSLPESYIATDEIASRIPDGALIGIPKEDGGVAMEITRALIRRGATKLRLLTVPVSSMQADILIGAGCVSEIETSGEVRFEDAPGERGTRVSLVMAYDPPAGALGRAVAKLFLREPQVQARHDLKRFKMLMETGEIATSARTRDETRAAKQENG